MATNDPIEDVQAIRPTLLDRPDSAVALLIRMGQLPDPTMRAAIRENAYLTQAELARILGTSRVNLHRWEKGITTPRGDARHRYAEVLAHLSSWGLHAAITVVDDGLADAGLAS
jgi:DNA-binding transcriptional regulator YiaG